MQRMATVFLGNTKVHEAQKPDPDRDERTYVLRADIGQQTTVVHVPEDASIGTALAEVGAAWREHSPEPPAWVDSEDDDLRQLLSSHFSCPAEMPEGWTHGRGRAKTVAGDIDHLAELLGPSWPGALRRARGPQMLKTNAGIDLILNASFGTAAQPAAGNYMAVTANATAPAAGDTTLTAEIATAGGGLVRAQATYAHTTGTNTATLTKVFTANGSDALPVTLAKFGVFNAASAGVMVLETLLSPTATLSASGDSVTITDTLTLT